jgi:type I restriction enzyme S subunit
MPQPEQQARTTIDALLTAAGWHVCDADAANIHVASRLVETEAELARREGRSFETGAQLLQLILETRRIQWQGKGKYKEPAAPNITDLPELPEGWVWANFESAADRVTVGHVGSMKNEYVEVGVPFLRSQNVRANRYGPEGLKFVSDKFHRQLGKSSLKPGDIVVVRSGSVGVSCVIPDNLPDSNCSDLVIIKAPRAVLPDFGAYYMNSVVETRIAAGKVGIALTHFNTQSVAELPLPVPPLVEQQRIVTEVERCLSIVCKIGVQVDANLKRAVHLRQSVLRNAFARDIPTKLFNG